MVDATDILSVGAALAAAAVAVAALNRNGGRRVFNVSLPNESDPSGGTTPSVPDSLPSPGRDWEFESPSSNPDENDTELEFGTTDPGPPDPTAGTTIPDSLSGFDPAGRVDLVNQDSDNGGTWVGL